MARCFCWIRLATVGYDRLGGWMLNGVWSSVGYTVSQAGVLWSWWEVEFVCARGFWYRHLHHDCLGVHRSFERAPTYSL
jgi:hypothetical protein